MSFALARRLERLENGTSKTGIADRLREARARYEAGERQPPHIEQELRTWESSGNPLLRRMARANRRAGNVA